MLTENQIRGLIVKRIFAACDSCNSHHTSQCDAQIRTLIAVLNDGRKPPSYNSVLSYLDDANIPYTMSDNGKRFDIDDTWLAENTPPNIGPW